MISEPTQSEPTQAEQMPSELTQAELIQQVRAWIADDPDPLTRAELTALLEALPASLTDLAERFSGPLRFGTAGLRGPVRAGPNGMNRAVVTATTAGLMRWLAERENTGAAVVIGHDARNGSAAFAEQAARVVTGAGRRALLLPPMVPTPVLANAVLRYSAAAGIMITASHNPPADNGYKVYLGLGLGGPFGDGAQIVSPADAEIEAQIRGIDRLGSVPLGPAGTGLGEEAVAAYVAAAVEAVGGPHCDGRPLVVAYTPMHGVGLRTLRSAMLEAGYRQPAVVAAQAEPDPDFPTVAFPNPEEPGAMDAVLELAATIGADLAIATDPDADRCAVAVPVPDPTTGASSWRALRGDELGALLADHMYRHGRTGRYATSIVSSQLLGAMCSARGLAYTETLTGFKWLTRAGDDMVFAYEEALGYCVAPHHVRDKDGITAALLVCQLASELAATGHGLADRLDELAERFGVYATDQLSLRVTDLGKITEIMARLRADPPGELLGEPVHTVDDLLPTADVVRLRTTSARVVVRPSGTEPKLKAYLEVLVQADGDVPAARATAADRLALLRRQTAEALGIPG